MSYARGRVLRGLSLQGALHRSSLDNAQQFLQLASNYRLLVEPSDLTAVKPHSNPEVLVLQQGVFKFSKWLFAVMLPLIAPTALKVEDLKWETGYIVVISGRCALQTFGDGQTAFVVLGFTKSSEPSITST